MADLFIGMLCGLIIGLLPVEERECDKEKCKKNLNFH